MSDQISVTLKTLSNTMQLLSQSLENEKLQHIELLKKLNSHLTHSQTQIKKDVSDFLNKVELQEFASIVEDSKLNIEKNQLSVNDLTALIEQIKIASMKSIEELDKQSIDVVKKISESSDQITHEIVKNVAQNVKDSITQNFISQFKDQNDKLVSEVQKARQEAMKNVVSEYNNLLQQANTVSKNHEDSLLKFKNDVDRFKESTNAAIQDVMNAFNEVENLTDRHMLKVKNSADEFREYVIKNLKEKIQNISRAFDHEVNKISEKISERCEISLDKINQVNTSLEEKATEVQLKISEHVSTTEKILDVQTRKYDQLKKELNFKFFTLNTNALLTVLLIFLIASCVAATVQNKKIENQNIALEKENQKLRDHNVVLLSMKKDSIELANKSINDVKKKFPNLQVTLNCKSLDN